MSKAKKLRIDVGGGLEPRENFINVDMYAEGKDIVKAPAWNLPYEDGTVDEINCSHVLEHIEKRMIHPTLAEFHRVLKPAGLLCLEVPDLVYCCQLWLQTRGDGWERDTIFGNEDDPGQFHKTGFDKALLLKYIKDAGFTRNPPTYWEPFSHNQRCLHVEVLK
jgi:predicted SAM-dependent methyltransferase